LLRHLFHMFRALLCVVAATTACVTPRVVPLRPTAPTDAASSPGPLHVIPYIDDAQDPLPLQGDDVVFAGVASTLAETIRLATASWAERHRAARPGGWELRVDLIQSRAEESRGRITVELAARVTLNATIGQVYLAQTHGYCKRSDVLARDPTASVYGCMDAMAHDLAGWIEGVQP
jgi:hypothetical protein